MVANSDLSVTHRTLPFAAANGGLLDRLRVERQVLDLLQDDLGGALRLFVEHAAGRWYVAVERDSRTTTAVGPNFAAAWAALRSEEAADV